jgi:hypothetical protein
MVLLLLHPAHRHHGQVRGAMARATSIDPRAATGVSADAARGIPRCGIARRGGNNDRLSTPWREVISLARVARSFSSGGLNEQEPTLKIQVRSFAVALAIAVPIAVATAKSSAAPINGSSVKAAVPALTMDVRYRVRRSHPYPSYWGYPTYNSYWGYPAYNSYWGRPTYNPYSSYPTYYYPGFSYGWW